MNIHKSQLFWGSLGTRVLTHPQLDMIWYDMEPPGHGMLESQTVFFFHPNFGAMIEVPCSRKSFCPGHRFPLFHFTSKPPLQKYAGTVLSYSRSHGSRSHHSCNSPWHRLPWRSSWRLPQWTPCRVTGGRLHYASRWALERARRTWLGPRPRWCSKWPGHCGKSPCRHLVAGPSSNTGSEGDLPTPPKKNTTWW